MTPDPQATLAAAGRVGRAEYHKLQDNLDTPWSAERADADLARAVLSALGIEWEQHYIEFRVDGWAIEHSLQCRLAGSMLDCNVHQAADEYANSIDEPQSVGRFPCGVDEDGWLTVQWEEVTDG